MSAGGDFDGAFHMLLTFILAQNRVSFSPVKVTTLA